MLRFRSLLALLAFHALLAAAPRAQAPPDVRESTLVEAEALDETAEAADTSSTVTVLEIDPATHGSIPLSELLSRSAGVEVRRYGGLGAFATLSIRGSSPAQVTVYLDGIPLNDAASGIVNIDEWPAGSLERIEIYRGTAPGRFAAAGIGGVVNLVTRRAGAVPSWQASAELGPYDTLGGRLGGGLRRGPLGLHGTLHVLRSEGDFDFLDDNGTPLNSADDTRAERQNNAFEQLDGSARLELVASPRLALQLVADAHGRSQGIPGPGADQAEQTRFDSRHALVRLEARLEDFAVAGGTLRASLHGASRREHYRDPLGEVGIGVQDQVDRFTRLGAQAHATVPVGPGRLSALLELEREGHRLDDRLAASTQAGREPSHRRTGASLVLEEPLALARGRWELTPRLRLQRLVSDFASPEPTAGLAPETGLTALSPSLGLRGVLGRGFELKANAGRAVRAPGFAELFGDRGSLVGNPTLAPEKAWSLDAGLLRTRPALGGRLVRFEATLFASLVDELIAVAQYSSHTFRPLNIGAARVLGLELSALGRLAGAELSLAYTLQDARDRSAVTYLRDNELAGRSRHHLSAWLRRELGPLRLQTSAELLSANYLDRANLQRAGARFYQGLAASAGGRGGWPELSVELRNLWDERTADVGGFPLPGRSLFLGVRWHWQAEER